MELARFWRHVWMSPLAARRAFPPATLDAIQRAIADSESHHRGEVCFVVETELTTAQLWAEVDSRQRARQVFAAHGVWNTEENNGVLVYLLLADRKVEVVADRGVAAAVPQAEWDAICSAMQAEFRAGRFEQGAVKGVQAACALLQAHFPSSGPGRNELPDRPIMI